MIRSRRESTFWTGKRGPGEKLRRLDGTHPGNFGHPSINTPLRHRGQSGVLHSPENLLSKAVALSLV
jgi:hypothetical protein